MIPLLTFVFLGAVATLTYIYYYNTRKSINLINLPPGPFPVPIIGNLHLMFGKKSILDLFDDLKNKYGDIFTFYMGQKPVVVMCGYDVIKEAFLANGDTFSSHNESFITRELGTGRGIISSSGRVWEANRCFTVSALRELGFGKNTMQPNIQKELDFLTERLSEVADSGMPIDLRDPLFCAISNTINSIVLGKRFNYDDEDFVTLKTAVDEAIFSVRSGAFFLAVDWLRYLPGYRGYAKRLIDNSRRVISLVEKIIDGLQVTSRDGEPENFCVAYNNEIEKHKGEENSIFDRTQMVYTISDLFIAGSETTALFLYWVFAYLVNYPDIQEDLANEIREKIGFDRTPIVADKKSIPLAEAIINEILRISDLVAPGVPHSAAVDAKLLGYDVPKGTPIVPLLHGVSYDKQHWEDPENFRPSRWIDADGHFFIPEHAIFFSIGKRSCPGEALARMESFLVVTSLLQKFKFSVPDNGDKPSLVGRLSILNTPKDYTVKITHRN